MAFSQTNILDVTAKVQGTDLLISWTSNAASGTTYQVYVDKILTWFGTQTSTVIPYPTALTRIDVGTVAAGEGPTNFASSLPTVSGQSNRVTLTWQGGTWEAADISGFHIYSSPSAGTGIDYTTIVATIAVYTQNVITDGWGDGGWGDGGWGDASGTYSWTSQRLCNGVWQFAVVPYDTAGNEGASQTVSVTISAPPRAPAPNASGQRLTYSNFHTSGNQAFVTLNWLASPAC